MSNREEKMSELSEKIIEQNLKYSLFTWSAQKDLHPMIFDHAEGMYMYDMDGTKYLEFASDQVDCNIGKSNSKVIQAMKDQLDKISYAEPAVPGCIKAFDHTCYHCPFHKSPETCDTECAQHIENLIRYEDPDNVAAVVVESVTGANGMCPPPKDYMKRLREICDRYQVLLICDEVMAGFGRTGKFFAFENFGIIPDMVTMAKGLTSGYIPLGAVVVTNKIASYFDEHVLKTGLTYSGHVLGCAAANACIDVMEQEHMVENSCEMGKYLKECELNLQAKHPCIGEVRGIGLMTGMEIVFNRNTHESMHPLDNGINPIEKFNEYMIQKHHIMVGIKQPKLIVLAPALNVTKEQIDTVICALDDGLKILDDYVREE